MNLPTRLGKYELVEFLGGGMSHVYRAIDTVIGRTVAVKILTPEGCADQETKDRFLQEARMAGNITHDNVINIYDFGEDHGQPFLVMEYLQGDTLRALIQSGRTGNLNQRLSLALQAAHALGYVHSQKIIHRDVKPDNLHVSTKGVVKLMDFGIAKGEDLSSTRAGFVLGTPYYMAPEQVRGEKITSLVDIYAFGIVLFELIAGVKPFKADSVEQIFHCILQERIDITPLTQAQVPPALIRLIERCTAKNPQDRPPGFREIIGELETIQAAGDDSTVAPLPQPPRRAKWLIPAGVAVAALLIAFAYLASHHSDIKPRQEVLPSTLSTPTGEMVLIPSGPFLSGENKESISLPNYYIDKTEVTNGSFKQYCLDRHRQLPQDFPLDRLNEPVVKITIIDAKDYADWAHKRLPSALEWEKAARGADGRKYPWGNEADPARANINNSKAQPWPADQAGGDISPYGVKNMAGNVAEFVDQLRAPSEAALKYFQKQKILKIPPTAEEPWYTVRGSSYTHPLMVIYEWGTVPARLPDPAIGFRCVRNARP